VSFLTALSIILCVWRVAANDIFYWRHCTLGPRELIFPVLQSGKKAAMPQLTFVVTTNRHQRTADSRKTVRSHVMQNYRRNQILQNLKTSPLQHVNPPQSLPRTAAVKSSSRTQNVAPGGDDSICLNCGGLKTRNFDASLTSFESRALQSHLTNVSSNGHIDPFSALPVNTVRGSYLLFNHGNYF
jgi:hypothetical protein